MKVFMKINDSEKERVILELCRSFGAETKALSYDDLGKKVVDIVDGSDGHIADNSSIPVFYSMPEIMLFSSLDEESLKMFLSEYRKREIEKIRLKAVVTPYNLGWRLYDLIEHLKEEAGIK